MHNKEMLPGTNFDQIDFIKRSVDLIPIHDLYSQEDGDLVFLRQWLEVFAVFHDLYSDDQNAEVLAEYVEEVLEESSHFYAWDVQNELARQAAHLGLYEKSMEHVGFVVKSLGGGGADMYDGEQMIPEEAVRGLVGMFEEMIMRNDLELPMKYFELGSAELSKLHLKRVRKAAMEGKLTRELYGAHVDQIGDEKIRTKADMIYGLFCARNGRFHEMFEIFSTTEDALQVAEYSQKVVNSLSEMGEDDVLDDFAHSYMDWADSILDSNESSEEISNAVFGLLVILRHVKDNKTFADLEHMLWEILHDEEKRELTLSVESILMVLTHAHGQRGNGSGVKLAFEMAEEILDEDRFDRFVLRHEPWVVVLGGEKETALSYGLDHENPEDNLVVITSIFRAATHMGDLGWVYDNLSILENLEDEVGEENGENLYSTRLYFELAKKFFEKNDVRYKEMYALLSPLGKMQFLHEQMIDMRYGDWMGVFLG